jgi:alkanesulfonate monooxygenase SsuD/methylene tetrahydromethanopterin reductase-like flavin-dependent oxidoreductase (luciferase family)
VKFFGIHLMPYTPLDPAAADKYNSAWVTLPNTYFDRDAGHALYERFITELQAADAAGFDGICVNEHHQNAYGLMPVPGVIAGALARNVKGRLAVLGRALPLVNNPLTIAEEYAMLDQMCDGRLIAGFVRGIGAEYHSTGVNPTESHARFHEAHDLIMQAWTRPGPFHFAGKYYDFEYVNTWPLPKQRPHPTIWIPSQGSSETIEWAASAERKYTYLQTLAPTPVLRRYMGLYKEEARKNGYEASPDQLGWSTPMYVAKTDEQAYEEARPHFEAFMNRFLYLPAEMLLPPGYTSGASIKMMRSKLRKGKKTTMEECIELGMFVCGSPKTVRETLLERQQDVGFGNLLSQFQFGTLPHDLTMRNIEYLASDVWPFLRERVAPAPAAVAS